MPSFNPFSHFFVDHSNLEDADNADWMTDAFGPVVGNETTQFRTTSFVQASAPTKVFAICNGQVLIQPQTGDPTKVNLILKPAAAYTPIKIKYFIYRGVNKSDLIDNANKLVTIDSNNPDQPLLLQRIWNAFISFYSQGNVNPVPTEIPGRSIGYDESVSGNTLLDSFLLNSSNTAANEFYQVPSCNQGELLGNFTGKIGLDVILDYGDYRLVNQEELFRIDLEFARKSEHIFNTASAHLGGNSIKVKRYKEHILQFLDAAAFWGSHIKAGKIKLQGIQTPFTTSQQIFPAILKKYQSANKIYIHIQGERARSYGFYVTSRKVFGFDDDNEGKLYETNGWPILIEEKTHAGTGDMTTLNIGLEYLVPDTLTVNNIYDLDRHISGDIFVPALNKNFDAAYPLVQRPTGAFGLINRPFNFQLSYYYTGSNPHQFSVHPSSQNPLPSGLTLNANSGEITGTPTSPFEGIVLFKISFASSPDSVIEIRVSFHISNSKFNFTPFRIPVSQQKACATFLFLYANLKLEFPLKNYYNQLWPADLSTIYSNSQQAGDNLVIACLTFDKNRLLNLDDKTGGGAIIQNKVIFEQGLNLRRTNIASLKRNTLHTQEADSINVVEDVAQSPTPVKNKMDYIEKVYNDPHFNLFKGVFYDAVKIYSLTLIHSVNFYKKKGVFQLGIIEEEHNKLIYNNLQPQTNNTHLPVEANNVFYFLEEVQYITTLNVRKYKVGLQYENASGDISDPLFPGSGKEVFVYTIDGFLFFSKAYTDNQKYYDEFAPAAVEFVTIPGSEDVNNPSILPVPPYNGEFGFDWMRIDESAGLDKRPGYRSSIIGGYQRPKTANQTDTNYQSNHEAYKSLVGEYYLIPKRPDYQVYHIPYLSLFSLTTKNKVANTPPVANQVVLLPPPHTAKLRVYIEITGTINRLEFDYNTEYFSIDIASFQENQITAKKQAIEKTVTITCLKDFAITQQIRVLAYASADTPRAEAQLAGLILVNKNHFETLTKIKFALVKIETDSANNTLKELGTFTVAQKDHLAKAMYQLLFLPTVIEESNYYLPLSRDADFQTNGKFMAPPVSTDVSYTINSSAQDLYKTLKDKFFQAKPAYMGKGYFLIFSFGLKAKGGTLNGRVEQVGEPNVLLFKVIPPERAKDDKAIAHEALHGLGLYHTHSDGTITRIMGARKYIFPVSPENEDNLSATDNLMSYSFHIKRTNIWQWQSEIIRKLFKQPRQ